MKKIVDWINRFEIRFSGLFAIALTVSLILYTLRLIAETIMWFIK
jgi:hypothetical protein